MPNYNYFRDYDPQTGRYIESDPAGLSAGINPYLYVDANPVSFFDPNGLGKEGGQTSLGGNDPLIPRSVNKNSTPEQIAEQVKKVEDAIKNDPSMNPKRVQRLKAWIKVARRGFTKVVCPPMLEDLAKAVAREQCLAGDTTMCQVFLMLGGEIDSGT